MFSKLSGNCFCLYDNKKLLSFAFVWNEKTINIQEFYFISNNVKLEMCKKILEFFDTSKILCTNIYQEESENYACIKFHNKLSYNKEYLINLLYN